MTRKDTMHKDVIVNTNLKKKNVSVGSRVNVFFGNSILAAVELDHYYTCNSLEPGTNRPGGWSFSQLGKCYENGLGPKGRSRNLPVEMAHFWKAAPSTL